MIRNATDGGLVILTLDRSDKANALTASMLETLIAALEDAQDARALILTGTGKVFSAGADLDEARAGLAVSPLWEALSSRIAALPCLTIAALNGTVPKTQLRDSRRAGLGIWKSVVPGCSCATRGRSMRCQASCEASTTATTVSAPGSTSSGDRPCEATWTSW